MFRRRHFLGILVFALGLMLVQAPAWGGHSWGNYHWARSSNPFTLNLGDNCSSDWDPYLVEAAIDWSQSKVLNLNVVAGSSNPKNCKATDGMVQVCNNTYGNNGWLGVAGIYASGDHITKAYAKMNDTYYNTPTYNTPAWRRLVMCQELGHTFGLDHQDENFSNGNLGTCMDYTSDPDGPPSNEHPNAHDYDMLETIYAHLDGGGGGGGGNCNPRSPKCNNGAPPAMGIDFDGPGQWGKLLKRSKDGHVELYMLDFGRGHKVFHWVIWVESRNPRH